MSRRVPRTLRTLKLDYREIAALLLFPLASLSPPPPAPRAARFPPLLRPPRSSSSSTTITNRVVPRVLPVVRIACTAMNGKTYLVGPSRGLFASNPTMQQCLRILALRVYVDT